MPTINGRGMKAAVALTILVGSIVSFAPALYAQEDDFSWVPAEARGGDAVPAPKVARIPPVIVTETPKPTADASKYTREYVIDLKKFNISNDGTHAAETSKGINAALQDAKKAGANRIVFPKGTYLILETDPVVFDHQDTIVDLNGATLQVNANALPEFCTAKIVDGASNFRLTNGAIRGDRDTHTGSKGEWGHTLLLVGGSNLEVDHLTLSNAWGDGLVTKSNTVGAQRYYTVNVSGLEQGAFTPKGVKAPSDAKMRTIEPYDISGRGGRFEFGYTVGYQGFPRILDRNYQAYFYKDDMTFVEEKDCIQFRKQSIPKDAKFMHLEFNQASVDGKPKEACGFISDFRPPEDVYFHDLTIVQNRRNGLSVCGGQRMVFENILFKKNGGTAPGFGVDYEDGWELMHDIVFRNNTFEDNVKGDLVVCAGSELIFEGNKFQKGAYVWGRTHNYTFLKNQFNGGGVTYRTKTGVATMHDNIYEGVRTGPKVIYDGKDLPTVRLHNETLHNCAMEGGHFVKANVVNDVKLHFSNCTFEDSVIKVSDAESHDNTFIRCTITDSRWNSHGAHKYTNCTIKGLYTISHTNTNLIEFDGGDLTDVAVDIKRYAKEARMSLIFKGCMIVLNKRSLAKVMTDRLDLLQITDCTIENKSKEEIIDNRTAAKVAGTITLKNNKTK